ncbi:MAG: response regulator [Endomicrobia bacterium]|nr:response regulator [Endomicrobiia bacterium]MDW8055960.1 response regulator [Elusimicrobiota bacterium]
MTKILIIEDDLELQDLMRFSFEHAGYSVYQAYNGKEGLERTKEILPDIIILDVLMPEMNGFEVIEELKKDPQVCLIPVIMLTSLSHTRDKLTGIKLGADEYLVKPVEPYELIFRVEQLLKNYYENVDDLTRLPRLVQFENKIKECLATGKHFKLIYIDLCNFKAYQLKFGFQQGDNVIRLFSSILRSAVKNYGDSKDSVYRLEADDFGIISFLDDTKALIGNITLLFEDLKYKIYDSETLNLGYYTYGIGSGVELKSDFLRLAVSIIDVSEGKYKHYAELITFAKELLATTREKCKQNFSNYTIYG